MQLFSFKKNVTPSSPNTLYAPVDGECFPITQMADPIFADKILGDGIYILPTNYKVYSPIDGTIVSIADSLHAYGILSPDGIEVLIHIGIDTVALAGRGFKSKIAVNQPVSKGELICVADMDLISEAGYSTQTAVVVANSAEYLVEEPSYGICTAKETPIFKYCKK